MAFSESDWSQHLKAKDLVRAARPREQSRVAEVQAKLLTQDAKWDVFLQRLQHLKEAADASMESAMTGLAGPVVNRDEMMAFKLNHASARAISETLERVMNIPKEIIGEEDIETS